MNSEKVFVCKTCGLIRRVCTKKHINHVVLYCDVCDHVTSNRVATTNETLKYTSEFPNAYTLKDMRRSTRKFIKRTKNAQAKSQLTKSL